MSLTDIGSLSAIVLAIITAAAYFGTKIKDAEEMGRLKERVAQLEKQEDETKETRDKIDALTNAVATLTEKFNNLVSKVDELTDEVRRRKNNG